MDFEKILTNKTLRLIVPMLMALLLAFFLRNSIGFGARMNRQQCNFEQKVKSKKLSGIIVKNGRDINNKRLRTLIYVNGKDTLKSNFFYYEISDFFNYLKPGDFIRKDSASLNFFFKRNGKDSTYKLNYGCK